MGSSSSTDICILLVSSGATSLKPTITVLLEANYRVAIAFKGEDALNMIQGRKRKVDMVLTETSLPDMCAFLLVQILATEFRMPVLMLSETYHIPTILRGLLNGAMFCLSKPLHLHDVDKLWEYPLIKKKNILKASSTSDDSDAESGTYAADEIEESESEKGKFEGAGPSMGLPEGPRPFMWTPDIHAKFLIAVWDLEIHGATPAELLHRIDAPGLTIEIITEKLQKYFQYAIKQLQELVSKYQTSRLMGDDPTPVEEKEITFSQWLQGRTGVYADPFPWAMEMLMSADAMLGCPPHISFAMQAPPRRLSEVVRRFVPLWYTAFAEAPPYILNHLLPPQGEESGED